MLKSTEDLHLTASSSPSVWWWSASPLPSSQGQIYFKPWEYLPMGLAVRILGWCSDESDIYTLLQRPQYQARPVARVIQSSYYPAVFISTTIFGVFDSPCSRENSTSAALVRINWSIGQRLAQALGAALVLALDKAQVWDWEARERQQEEKERRKLQELELEKFKIDIERMRRKIHKYYLVFKRRYKWRLQKRSARWDREELKRPKRKKRCWSLPMWRKVLPPRRYCRASHHLLSSSWAHCLYLKYLLVTWNDYPSSFCTCASPLHTIWYNYCKLTDLRKRSMREFS